MNNKRPILEYPPILAASPFVPSELFDGFNLFKDDRNYFGAREKTIEAGLVKFLAVGRALIEIRDYRAGLLRKRYGGWEQYCEKRLRMVRGGCASLTRSALRGFGSVTAEATFLLSQEINPSRPSSRFTSGCRMRPAGDASRTCGQPRRNRALGAELGRARLGAGAVGTEAADSACGGGDPGRDVVGKTRARSHMSVLAPDVETDFHPHPLQIKPHGIPPVPQASLAGDSQARVSGRFGPDGYLFALVRQNSSPRMSSQPRLSGA